jgi:hypothetical protein
LCSGAGYAQKFAGGLLADAIDNPPAPFRAAWWHSGVARLRRDPNLGKRLDDFCQSSHSSGFPPGAMNSRRPASGPD